MGEVLDIDNETLTDLISMTSPGQAVDTVSELAGLTLWSDYEWIPYEEALRQQFQRYEGPGRHE